MRPAPSQFKKRRSSSRHAYWRQYYQAAIGQSPFEAQAQPERFSPPGWQVYQIHLKQRKARRQSRQKAARWFFLLLVLGAAASIFTDISLERPGKVSGHETANAVNAASDAPPRPETGRSAERSDASGTTTTPAAKTMTSAVVSRPDERKADAAIEHKAPLPRTLNKALDKKTPESAGFLLSGIPKSVRRQPRPAVDKGERRNLPLITKTDLRRLLDPALFINPTDRHLYYDFDGRSFEIETTLDPDLQRYMLEIMDDRYARFLGMVVMVPDSGKILGMVGYDREDPDNNPCTATLFPAASIFKIVTAAGAVDACEFNANSLIAFSGRKHTLYQYQLQKRFKNARHLSLRDAFAQSVNPIFGRIGIHYLGKDGLATYAEALGFNRKLGFEVPVAESVFELSVDEFQWAEVASGFNRTTLISPLHGAVMTAAVTVNQGWLVEPSLVETMRDQYGRLLYRASMHRMNRAVNREVAESVKDMMVETVRTGTGRKAFRNYRDDPVMERLNVGGKTGTINGRPERYRRFDWFVGFAEEKGGGESIVVAVAVAHDRYIGTQSKEYVPMIIRRYFENRFAKRKSGAASKRM